MPEVFLERFVLNNGVLDGKFQVVAMATIGFTPNAGRLGGDRESLLDLNLRQQGEEKRKGRTDSMTE